MQGPLAAGRGELIAPEDRRRAVDLLEMGTAAGAPASGIARILGVSARTLRRWREAIRCSGISIDGRKGAPRRVAHKLTAEERQQVIDTVNDPRFADLTPAQIIAILAEEGVYIASEMSFYRIMREEGLLHHRGSTKPPREPRPPQAGGQRAEPDLELGHHPAAQQNQRPVALSLHGDGCLEPQDCGG